MTRFALLGAALAIACAPAAATAAPSASRRPHRADPPAERPPADPSSGEDRDEAAGGEEEGGAERAAQPEVGDPAAPGDEAGEAEEAAAAEPTASEQPAAAEAEAGAAARPAAGESAPELPPEDIQTFAEATLEATPLHFAFNAFGDVSAAGASPAQGDESATFSLGTFALLINGQLAKSLLGTAEMAFNASEQNEQEVTLERLHLRWQTPRFFIVAGRTHSDMGYWNTAFHHGAWLHLPIARPRVLRGEEQGGILPIHWIGVEGGVRIPIGSSALNLGAGVGNGRGHDEQSIPLRKDTNDFKAIKVKMEVLGLGLPDLRVGVGGMYGGIAAEPMEVRPALPDQRIDEYIANVYTAYRGSQLTLIAEAYSIWHRAEEETFQTFDAFAVVGYRIGRVTPYAQVERTLHEGGVDPFYTPVPDMPTSSTPIDRSEALFGLRVDPSVWSAIKVEYRLGRADDVDGLDHTLAINWSFGI
jgi:hypothetical protein